MVEQKKTQTAKKWQKKKALWNLRAVVAERQAQVQLEKDARVGTIAS